MKPWLKLTLQWWTLLVIVTTLLVFVTTLLVIVTTMVHVLFYLVPQAHFFIFYSNPQYYLSLFKWSLVVDSLGRTCSPLSNKWFLGSDRDGAECIKDGVHLISFSPTTKISIEWIPISSRMLSHGKVAAPFPFHCADKTLNNSLIAILANLTKVEWKWRDLNCRPLKWQASVKTTRPCRSLVEKKVGFFYI